MNTPNRRTRLTPRPIAAAVALALLAFGGIDIRDAAANPTGAQLTAGAATVSQPNAQTVIVNQTTHRAALDWTSFSIGAGESVIFQQPSASAVALNRVVGPTASTIHGTLQANGQVFLINPSGVLFGRGANVDVAGLVASTLNISNQDFMAGRYLFTGSAGSGSVINEGTIRANGGFVALLSNQVSNTGTIVANNGSIALGAGDSMLLDFNGDGLLSLKVNGAAAKARIDNGGIIQADGGVVIMSAQAKNALVSTVLNVEGIVQARGMVERGGHIYLDGGSSGVTQVSGTLDASSAQAKGGEIRVLGEYVGLFGNANLNASGATGGGTVLVGGDFQGKNPLIANAFRTYVGAGTQIKADAITSGDGGKVIVWADEVTRYFGNISARGGSHAGNGGFVEVSGKQSLVFQGRVDAAAPHGKGGTLLLDPNNINVVNGGVATLAAASGNGAPTNEYAFAESSGGDATLDADAITGLTNAGTSVLLQANADITISEAINSTGAGSLTLQAGDNVSVNDSISLNGGTLSIVAGNTLAVNAGNLNANTGSVTLQADEMTLNGTVTGNGGVTLRPNTAGTVITLGAGTDGLDFTNAALQKVFTTGVLTIGADGASAAGSITIGGPIAGGSNWNTLSLRTGGAVIDGNAAAGPDITVTNLAIRAATGIGSAADPLETMGTGATPNLKLAYSNTGAGGVTISNSSRLTLAAVDGLTTLNVGSGAIRLRASSPVDITMSISAPSIDMTAGETGGANDNLRVFDGVTVEATAGDVTLRAGDQIIVGLTATTALVKATGTVTLISGFDDIPGAGVDTITGTGRASAPNVVLDSLTGVGSSGTRFNTTAGTLAARSRTSGGVFVTELNDVILNTITPTVADTTTVTNSTNGGGAYNLSAGGTITITGPITADGAGNVDLRALGGTSDIAINGGSVTSGSGTLQLIAGQAITTSTATGTTTELSTTGGARLQAGTTIGTMNNRIDTAVGTLAARAAGNIFFNQTGAVTVGSVAALNGAAQDPLVGITTTANNGSITLVANNNIVVDQNVTANGSGAVLLNATGNILLNAAVGASTTGAISILADSDGAGGGTLTTAATAPIGNASAGLVTLQGSDLSLGASVTGANVTLRPSTDGATIGINDNTKNFSVSQNEIIQITTSGLVTIGSTSNTGGITVGTDGPVTADKNIELVSRGTLTVNAAPNGITTTGALTLTANNMTLGGGLIQGSSVTLRPATAGQQINLGGADVVAAPGAGTLGLTSTEINTVTATGGTLTIGRDDVGNAAGAITISDAINNGAGATTLVLRTGSTITEIRGPIAQPSGSIAETNLGLVAGGSITLTENNNEVENLSGRITGTGDFSYTDNNSVNVVNLPAVNTGTTGIQTADGSITLQANSPGNSIGQVILSADLRTDGVGGAPSEVRITGPVVLAAPTVTIDTDSSVLAGGAGNVTFNNTVVSDATGGRTLIVDARSQGGSGGNVFFDGTVGAGGGMNKLGSLAVGGFAVTFTGTNNVDNLAVALTRPTFAVTYVDADALTVSTVGAIAGVATNGGTVTLTATGTTGDVTVNETVSSGSGALTLNAGRNMSLAGNLSTSGNVTLNSAQATATGTITAGLGTVTGALLTTNSKGGTTLNNNNTVTSFNATNTTSGAVSLTNNAGLTITGISQGGGGNVTVNNTGALTVSGNITAGAGAVTLTANSPLTLTNNANIVSATSVELNADAMNLVAGRIATTAGGTGKVPIVTLRPTTGGQLISLGGPLGGDSAGTLELNSADLANVYGNVLRVGRSNSGTITVRPMTFGNVDNLHLLTGADTTGAGSIVVPGLAIEAGGAVNMADPNTQVATFAANVTGGLTFTEADGFTIGTVDGVNGVTVGGKATLTSTTVNVNRPLGARQVDITADQVTTDPNGLIRATMQFINTDSSNAALALHGMTGDGIFGTLANPIRIEAPGLFVVTPNTNPASPAVQLSGDPAKPPVNQFPDAAHRPVFYNGQQLVSAPPPNGGLFDSALNSIYDLLTDEERLEALRRAAAELQGAGGGGPQAGQPPSCNASAPNSLSCN